MQCGATTLSHSVKSCPYIDTPRCRSSSTLYCGTNQCRRRQENLPPTLVLRRSHCLHKSTSLGSQVRDKFSHCLPTCPMMTPSSITGWRGTLPVISRLDFTSFRSQTTGYNNKQRNGSLINLFMVIAGLRLDAYFELS